MKFYYTLFLVLILVEASDVIFAVDSIPAIFAVTSDPFIVLTANLMAILGGNNPGKISWAKSVLERAEKSGLRLDSSGKIIELNSQ